MKGKKVKDQQKLDAYFSTVWNGRIEDRSLSGVSLINEVKDHERVLDVGCGFNFFKGKIKHLVGIDPANSAADVMTTIENFKSPELFDVAFCLGSVNFGEAEDVRRDLDCVIRNLKPNSRIYWRCNPGVHDHGNHEFDEIQVFPWTIELQYQFAKEFGYSIKKICWESGNRIYSEWFR